MATNKIKWNIIPPEIKNDNFYNLIINILSTDTSIKNVIEIGASSGEGSTEAIINGNLQRKDTNNMDIFSLEVCTERFDKLKARYDNIQYFHPLNMSSVKIDEFPSKLVIRNFHKNIRTILNHYPIDLVLSWYDSDKEYIIKNDIPVNGIEFIKKKYKINTFDFALIDGSEFTGEVELSKLLGSRYILLDDINAFKNYHNHQTLKNNKDYECITEDYQTRNGFSAFKKIK